MDDITNIHWELCKRNLDTRRLIILGALTVVTFGAWLLHWWLSGGSAIWRWPPNSTGIGLKLPAMLLGYMALWGIYFWILHRIDKNIARDLEVVQTSLKFSEDKLESIRHSMNFEVKFLPFLLGTAVFTLIMLPLD